MDSNGQGKPLIPDSINGVTFPGGFELRCSFVKAAIGVMAKLVNGGEEVFDHDVGYDPGHPDIKDLAESFEDKFNRIDPNLVGGKEMPQEKQGAQTKDNADCWNGVTADERFHRNGIRR
jgi:hypothetical protein